MKKILASILAFIKLSQCFFSWTNINSRYNNQKIAFSKDNGTTFSDIDFAQEVWTYNDIDNYIKDRTKTTVGDGNDVVPITLTFDEPTFRVIITLVANYQLDLTKSDFNGLIGYNKVILKDERNVGTRIPNLTEDTDVLNIHCNLVSES